MTSKNVISNDEKSLKSYIKRELLTGAKRLKNKYPPISENIKGVPKSLKIKKIYELKENHKNFYLINTKNYSKKPRHRYFLAIMLASQSSDLLVSLAKGFSKEHNLKLIQFSIYPQHFRVSLFSLKELSSTDNFPESINLLIEFRNKHRKELENLKNLIKNV